MAPRTHGKHNGLDLLAPIGTALRSPCSGSAKSAVSRSFGKWVKVCVSNSQRDRRRAQRVCFVVLFSFG